MRLSVAADPAAAAQVAAEELARACREAIAARGRAVVAVSGGETPWLMLREFASLHLPWTQIHVMQVDERVAPHADSRRSLARLEEILVDAGPLPRANLHAMPVEDADLERGCARYAAELGTVTAGRPPVLDLVQLGLGADGHTASLVPGDAVLAVADRDVALAGPYQGLKRMTLTYPALSRARERLWLVTGAAKVAALRELVDGGPGHAPALGVERENSIVIADAAASGS